MLKTHVFLLILLISCADNSFKSTQWISNYENKIASTNSMDYDVEYQIKHFSNENPLTFHVHCTLIRNTNDSLFGGAVWIDNDSIEKFYDLQNIYLIKHKEKKIIKFYPEKTNKFPIDGRDDGETLNVYFYNFNAISRNAQDSSVITIIKDSITNNKKGNLLILKHQDENEFVNMQTKLFINSESNLQNISFYVEDSKQKQFQKNTWNLSNVKYDKTTLDDLKKKLKSYTERYYIEDFVAPKPIKLLMNGDTAPNFSGKYVGNNEAFNLNDFQNKVVVLDFWYKNCPHCIESMPFLNQLYKKYGDDELLLFGLNPIDSEDFSSFIINNELHYPLVLIEKEVAMEYHISGFPTLYIINSKGQIAYSECGYHEDNNIIIEKIIDQLLIK